MDISLKGVCFVQFKKKKKREKKVIADADTLNILGYD